MKSLVEINELRDKIRKDLDRLPDKNAFGGSNLEEKDTMGSQIADLNRILAGDAPTREDVGCWYTGDDDYFLRDYLS